MTRRLVLCLAILSAVALLTTMAVLLDPTYITWGILRNESFFRGLPTSYWHNEVRRNSPDLPRMFGIEVGGDPDASAVPVLRELLQDEDDQVRFFASNALAINGPNAQAAIPDLAKWLNHPDIYHRRNGAHALAAIVRRDDEIEIEPLIRGLNENDTFVNYFCALVLGRLGPNARDALPSLLELSNSERAGRDILDREASQGTVREACEWAMKEITGGGPKGIEDKGK